MRIVFIGPPGSGKGTQAQLLKDYLQVPHLSTGEMLRDANEAGTALGAAAAECMQSGKFVPDEVVVGIVDQRLSQDDCTTGFLLDGFPRTVCQAESLDRLLAEHDSPLDLVVELDVAEDHLLKRLAARGRADDNIKTIHERFRQYEELTAPLLDYYRGQSILRTVDGVGTPENVYSQVKKVVGDN